MKSAAALSRAGTVRGNLTPEVRSGILMLAATGTLAGMHTVIRYLSESVHPFEIAFFRSFFGLLVLSPFIFKNGIQAFQTFQPRLNAVRGVTSLFAMLAWFYGLSVVELAKATALSFTNTMFGALAAVFFLKERMRLNRWLAVLAGFSGMLIILRPGWIEVSSGSLIILFSALCWGMGMVIVKKLTETDGTMSIILWFTLWTTIATFPFAASQWVWPEAEDYFWLFVMGILGSIGHLAAVSGFKIADASSVMPMDFLRLVWISLFGFLFFGEIPEVWTLIGAAVILTGSGLLIIPSKS